MLVHAYACSRICGLSIDCPEEGAAKSRSAEMSSVLAQDRSARSAILESSRAKDGIEQRKQMYEESLRRLSVHAYMLYR